MSLFVARAKSVNPSFERDPAIIDLCAALDELPLAIELAAARTVVFTPAQLQERLGQRLDLFKGDRDADPRQRTLRATIEWSYGLLSGSEQDLFRRFGVFAGGSSYEAVERICHVDADTLGSLIDKSLLLRRESETGPRFWMLETIREFALERLAAAGEEQDLRHAHATWFSRYVAELCWPVRENETGARPALLADLPNARAALAHAVSRRDPQLIGDCLFGLWWQWLTEGFTKEGKAAVDVWLDVDRSELTDIELVPGLLACGEILRFTGDTDLAAELKGQLLGIARAHPGEAVHAWSMDWMIPALLSDLSQIELARGDLAEARSIASEALSIRRHSRERRGIGHALVAAGIVDIVSGDPQGAFDRFAEAAEALEGTSDSWMAKLYSAECEVTLGDLAGATEHLRACLERLRQAPSVVDVADAARVSAGLAIEIGEHEVASELLGAFSRMSEDAGMPISIDAHWSHDHRRMTDLLRATLGEGGLGAGSRRGAQLTEEETLDLASLVTSRSASEHDRS
jgi:tetratricopeptide (TPR) repeat protein